MHDNAYSDVVPPDTLIVWTETNGTDMALSFQEADGCAAIWFALMRQCYRLFLTGFVLGNMSVALGIT